VQCTNPYYVTSQNLLVPCGKCLQCRIAHSREWALRVLHEMNFWEDSAFVTLTYSEENCPKSISKREL